jgi:hypothetical protein
MIGKMNETGWRQSVKAQRSKGHRILGTVTALTVTSLMSLLPVSAHAQDWNWRHREQQAASRQDTKNDWRNLAIAAGGVAAIGALKHDPTVTVLGAAGALYSLDRYNQDRASQNHAYRARAEIFSHPYVYRDGHRFDRRVVNRHGAQYYQFVRHHG